MLWAQKAHKFLSRQNTGCIPLKCWSGVRGKLRERKSNFVQTEVLFSGEYGVCPAMHHRHVSSKCTIQYIYHYPMTSAILGWRKGIRACVDLKQVREGIPCGKSPGQILRDFTCTIK